MWQRAIDIKLLRPELFKLKTLLLPEGITGQTRRDFARLDGERLTIIQPVSAQGRDLLAAVIDQPALRRLN